MTQDQRFHSLDAVRATALLLGIALHSTMSFWPGMREVRWPISDESTSVALAAVFFVIHVFRMSLFFAIAGFFGHVLLEKLGAWGFIRNRLRRIGLPLIAAMVVVMPLLILPFVWGQRQLGFTGPPAIAPPIPNPQLPPWGHLWFLYLLMVLIALWMLARALLRWFDRSGLCVGLTERVLAALMRLRLAPVVLAAPTAVLLFFTPWWSPWQGIPAPIMGLIPNGPALLAYGSAFAFGWFLHRRADLLPLLARDWMPCLLVAAALSAIALALIGAHPRLDVPELSVARRAAYSAAYQLATWYWMFGLMGAAVRFLSQPDPRWRYLADASFFLYLVHLPVVYLLQAWMLRWPLHWSVKYVIVLGGTLSVTLALYHGLVRRSFVGVFLNGRRYPRSEPPASMPNNAPG